MWVALAVGAWFSARLSSRIASVRKSRIEERSDERSAGDGGASVLLDLLLSRWF
jgi:hypothetical protein